MLKKKMKGMTMIVMTKMAQLVQQHIVLKDGRKSDNVQIKIDI